MPTAAVVTDQHVIRNLDNENVDERVTAEQIHEGLMHQLQVAQNQSETETLTNPQPELSKATAPEKPVFTLQREVKDTTPKPDVIIFNSHDNRNFRDMKSDAEEDNDDVESAETSRITDVDKKTFEPEVVLDIQPILPAPLLEIDRPSESKADVSSNVEDLLDSTLSDETEFTEYSEFDDPEVEQVLVYDNEVNEVSDFGAAFAEIYNRHSFDEHQPEADEALVLDEGATWTEIDYQSSFAVEDEAEAVLDEEVMDTYYQLIALADSSEDEATPYRAEIEQITIGEERTIPANEDLDTDMIEANAFAEFIDAQPQPIEPIDDIEIIKVNANEQPLEETLVQLASYLSEVSEENEESSIQLEVSEDIAAIRHLLQDINKEFIKLSEANPGKTETVRVTPDITQKLLDLLRVVGYQNPQEALVSFVSKHGFEFLPQAISYLYQLTNEDNQKELWHYSIPTFSTMMAEEPLSVRLGRSIFGLMKIAV